MPSYWPKRQGLKTPGVELAEPHERIIFQKRQCDKDSSSVEMWQLWSRNLVREFRACNPQVTSSVEPVEERQREGTSKHQCDVNTKLLQGCMVHLTNMCKPLTGKAKMQPSGTKKQATETHTHADSPAHTQMAPIFPANLSKICTAIL